MQENIKIMIHTLTLLPPLTSGQSRGCGKAEYFAFRFSGNSAMASIPCITHLSFTFKPSVAPPPLSKFHSRFLGIRNRLGWVGHYGIGPSNGSRAKCWFKFGKSGVDAEGAGIYGSQTREDFDRDDVEQVIIFFPLNFSLFTYICLPVCWR